MRLKTERGELVPKEEVVMAWVARFAQAKNSLMTIGQSATTDPMVAARILKSVRAILTGISAPGLPGVPDELLERLRDWVGESDATEPAA